MGGSLRVGNVEILSLTDGEIPFPMTLDQLFAGVTALQWEPYQRRYPEVFAAPNIWRAHWGCHLIRSLGHTILVDTGIGPHPAPLLGGMPGRLMEELTANSVRPAEIDTVFITHAHPDHVGGNLTADKELRFPEAQYAMSRTEWDGLATLAAGLQQAAGITYMDETMTPLGTLDALRLLDGETALTDEITAIDTPGHTPGHMSLLVSSGGERACIVGDTIVHPAMVTEPDWPFGFDFDTDRARDTRKHLLDRLEAEGRTIVGCHFPSPGYGKILRLEGRRYWQAL